MGNSFTLTNEFWSQFLEEATLNFKIDIEIISSKENFNKFNYIEVIFSSLILYKLSSISKYFFIAINFKLWFQVLILQIFYLKDIKKYQKSLNFLRKQRLFLVKKNTQNGRGELGF